MSVEHVTEDAGPQPTPARLSQTAVWVYATPRVIEVAADQSLESVAEQLDIDGISAAPVHRAGKTIGVISRSDLLRVGAPRVVDGSERACTIDLAGRTAHDAMHLGISTVERTTPVADAAATMAQAHMHRVFVTDDAGKPCGVFGTREVMLAIADARIDTPIGHVMTRGPLTVPHDAPLSLALTRLQWADVQGLVVVDGEWPLGVFTQREALAARFLPPGTRVEAVMNQALLCMRTSTPLHSAARHGAATRARRLLVVEDRKLMGVLTGLDFARLARDP